MKLKLLVSSMLMAGALIGSSSASADWTWAGTQADWMASTDNGTSTIVDDGINYPHPANGAATLSGDGDTTFTFMGSTFSTPVTNLITLSEQYLSGVDLYGVNISGSILGNSGYFGYKISTNDPDGLNTARLDTTTTLGIGNVSKYLFANLADYTAGVGGNYSSAILGLNSINSASDPTVGLTGFPTQSTFYVLDVINPVTDGALNNINNQFSISVPEPMTLIMLGLGLLGFGYSRRHAFTEDKGLSA